VLAAMETGRQADIYLARVSCFHWLDDNTSLTPGQPRYALEHGGIAQGKVHWLDQFKDGLIRRRDSHP
jgi:hypothetical protein